MTPERVEKIHTVRITNPETGLARISSFLATSEAHAKLLYRNVYKNDPDIDLANCTIEVSVPTINDNYITEAHMTHYGDIIQKVSKSRIGKDFYCDDHPVVTPELIRANYTAVSHSYICFDPDGNKVYIHPYDWVIIKKKEK
jgi:hypothetical protein